MADWRMLVAVVSLVGGLGGCNGLPRPRLFEPPGPIWAQRREATWYDPYPSEKLGPEVVGGRPREYQRPLPLPVHSQPLGPRPNNRPWGMQQ